MPNAFLDAVTADPRLNLHSILVLHRGRPVLEAYADPYTPTDRQLVYSVSKTFTQLACGLAYGEGLLRLDDRVVDLLPDQPARGRARALTVHHLLSMTTGHVEDTFGDRDLALADPGAAFWALEPPVEPGSLHAYNNGASWLLGEVVRHVTGQSLVAYLTGRLIEPLDLDLTWDVDAAGRELGFSGVHLTTRSLARVGQLLLDDGVANGARVIPEGWVSLASHRHVATGGDDPEWTYGYGYQMWLGREGYRLDGAYGQYALVFPDRQTVVAITSAQPVSSQPLLDAVHDHLLPAVERGLEGEVRRTLALRHPADRGAPGPWRHDGPVPNRPGLAVGAEQLHVPSVTDVRGRRDADGFEVTATIDGSVVRLVAPTQGWVRQRVTLGGVSVPIAVAAGTLSSGALRVYVCVTDSPHVLRIEIGPNQARLAWETSPLSTTTVAGLVAT